MVMAQTHYFLLDFLYTAAFCLALALGILFLASKKGLVSEGKLQKIVGIGLILIAVHLLFLNYSLFFEAIEHLYLQYLLVILDLGAFVYTIVLICKVLQVHKKEEQIAEEISEEMIREDKEDEEIGEIENPTVDDYLFFQKVEVLMVNEMLFCEQELSRENLAAAIGTNRTYLVRSIKNATGKTFSEYITDLRTAYAAKLLTTTDEPLDLIGTLVGFRSKSAYYRAFAAAYNCSPSDYRKKSVVKHNLS